MSEQKKRIENIVSEEVQGRSEVHSNKSADSSARLILAKQTRDIKETEHSLKVLKSKYEIDKLKYSSLSLVSSKNELELEDLKRAYNGQVVANRSLKNEIEKIEYKSKTLKEEFEAKKENLERQRRQCQQQKDQLFDLNQELSETNELKVKLIGQLEEARHQHQQFTKNVNLIEAKLAIEKEAIDKISFQYKVTAEKLSDSKSKLTLMENQKNQNRKQLENITCEFQNAQQETIAFNLQISNLENEINQQLAELEAKTIAGNDLRDKLVKIYKEASDKNYKNDLLKAKFKEVNQQVSALTAEYETKQMDVQKLEADLTEKMSQLSCNEQLVEELKLKLKVVYSTIDSISKEINQFEKSIYTNDLAAQELKSRLLEENTRYENLESRCHLLREEKSKQKNKLTELVMALETAQNFFLQREKEIDGINLAIVELNSQIQGHELEIKKTKNNISQQDIELSQFKKKHFELVHTEESLAKSVIDLIEQEERQKKLTQSYATAVCELQDRVSESSIVVDGLKGTISALLKSQSILDDKSRKILSRMANTQFGLGQCESIIQTQVDMLKSNLEKQKEFFNSSHHSALELSKQVDQKIQLMLQLGESLNQSKSEAEEKHREVSVLSRKLHDMNSVRPRLDEELVVAKEHLKKIELDARSLQKEYESNLAQEQALVEEIKLTKEKSKVKDTESFELDATNLSALRRIEELNYKLEELQNDHADNNKTIHAQKSDALELSRDLEELESHIYDLQTKLETQDIQKRDNQALIDSLASKSAKFNERLAALTAQARNNSAILAAQENQIEMMEESLKVNFNLESSVSDESQLASIEFESSRDFEIGLLTRIRAIKRKFETKFFNSGFNVCDSDFKETIDCSDQQLVAFEEAQEVLISSIVSSLSSQADIYGELAADREKLKSTLSFSNLGNISNESARKVLLPATQLLLAQFEKTALQVNFKLKVQPSGVIEKLGVTISLPTILEPNKSSEKINDL